MHVKQSCVLTEMRQLDFGAFEWILSDEDIACLKGVSGVMKDIVSILLLLEGDKYPTIPMVVPVLNFLKSGPFRSKPCDSLITKEFRTKIEDYVDSRYPILPLHNAATLLDPRFVQLTPFIPQYDRDEWTKKTVAIVKDFAEGIIPSDHDDAIPVEMSQSSSSSLDQSSQEPPPKKTKADNPFFEYMAAFGGQETRPQASKETTRQKVTKEMRIYLKTQQIEIKEDPLKWWQEQMSTFPVLAQVARQILAIPASSAPTERVFSKLARVNAKDRCAMKPSMADALLMF